MSSQTLALGLLDHRSSMIRLHALSLLIRSKSQKEILGEQVLRKLKASLPYFHCEMEPKTRNEFIALAQKLIMRVIAVMSSQNQAIEPCRPCAGIYGYTLALAQLKAGIPVVTLPPKWTLTSREKHNNGCTHLESRSAKKDGLLTAATLEHHVSFFQWYTSFLALELRSTATYQRHITALGILEHMQYKTPRTRSTCSSDPCLWTDEAGITKCPSYAQALVRPLCDLMTDAFDDVRASAASCLFFVLESCSQPCITNIDFPQKIQIAEKLMRATGRADHADGFARMCRLHCRIGPLCLWPKGNAQALEHALASLQADVKATSSHLRAAVEHSPLHGHISALRCGCQICHGRQRSLPMLTDAFWSWKLPVPIRPALLRTGSRWTSGKLC